MTIGTFTVAGTAFAAAAFGAATVYFVYGLLRGITGRAALLASLLTTLWFGASLSVGWRPATHMLEITAYLCWILFIARVLDISLLTASDGERRVPAYLIITAAGAWLTGVVLSAMDATGNHLVPMVKLTLCIIALVLLEQVARNVRRDYLWHLKFVILGLGVLYLYGFVLYADAVLFRAVDPTLRAAQGFVASLAVPFLLIASTRNRANILNVNVSRRFIFRSGTLLAAGIYLLLMGLAGYYVRLFGGDWGTVLQVLVLAVGLVGLSVIALSSSVRNYLRIVFLRTFYEYKYDYRDEWIRVTGELSASHADDGMPERAIRSLGEIVHSFGGAYWRLGERGVMLLEARVHTDWEQPISAPVSASMLAFFAEREWIVDLDEFREASAAYPGLTLSPDVTELPRARFLAPLLVEDQLFGIIVLTEPNVPMRLIWEDYDILKVIARQAAGVLALRHVDDVLNRSRELSAFNQMSAFVVHDIKTVNSQLSLLLSNAGRHRDNPAFVDDMVETTANAVRRMNELLKQLDKREAGTPVAASHDLVAVTRSVVERLAAFAPTPVLEASGRHVVIAGGLDPVAAAIGHIVRNAQEAAGEDGSVRLTVASDGGWGVLTITDDGPGMDREFVEKRLFSPFESTKGLSGMGVGAYQAREQIRQNGGDINVVSQPGRGTRFVLRLPMAQHEVVPEATAETGS